MPRFSIRLIDPTEEALLWAMLYHALYVPEGQEPFPKDIVHQPEIAKYACGWGKDGDKGYTAVDTANSQPVGAVWVRLFTADDPGYGYISDEIPELSIAILPACRNQGLGTRLMDCLMQNVRAQYGAVSLSVSAGNPARRLYERFGFEVLDQHDLSIIMKKSLRRTNDEN